MTFSKFTALLAFRTLRFTALSGFEDRHEGTLPQGNLDDMLDVDRKLYRHLRDVTTVNCWHDCDGESMAMWGIYAERGEGVAVQTTFERLTSAFLDDDDSPLKGETVHVERVKYLDFRTEKILNPGWFGPALCKRREFESEREVRALYLPDPFTLTEQLRTAKLSQHPGSGVDVAVDLLTLIEHIYVAPTSPDWFYRLVRAIVSDGLRERVRFSKVDDAPERIGGERTVKREIYAIPGWGVTRKDLDAIAEQLDKSSNPENENDPPVEQAQPLAVESEPRSAT